MSRGSQARRLHYQRSVIARTSRGAKCLVAIDVMKDVVATRGVNHGRRLPTGLEIARTIAKHTRRRRTKAEIHFFGRRLDALIRRISALEDPPAPVQAAWAQRRKGATPAGREPGVADFTPVLY